MMTKKVILLTMYLSGLSAVVVSFLFFEYGVKIHIDWLVYVAMYSIVVLMGLTIAFIGYEGEQK